MRLRAKVTLMVVSVFLVSAVLDLAIQRLVIMPSFYRLEREEALKNIGRVMEALNRELQVLNTTSSDWAYWDDLYAYATDRNRRFQDANLTPDALVDLKANYLGIYDSSEHLIWGQFIDLRTQKPLAPGRYLLPRLKPGHLLRGLTTAVGVISGILETPAGPLLLSVRHILTTADEGPQRGYFMIGRLLDAAGIRRISDQVDLTLSITALPDAPGQQEWIKKNSGDLAHSAFHLTQTRDTLVTSTLIPDLFGKPFLSLRVSTPRNISARGENAGHLAVISIAFSATLIMSFLLFMLHRTVTRPLSLLTAHAVRVGENDDLNTRLRLNRKDEVGLLAREFDSAMDRLREARAKLVDMSFRSGISEMASGVLHNIGNAITPLWTQMATLGEELRKIPASDIKSAVKMLSEPSTPEDRRADLARFVELGAVALADSLDKARERLASAMNQVEYVSQILADQERFSRNARVMEPVNIEELIVKTTGTLSPALSNGVDIILDESLGSTGTVMSSRATLQQVVNNLLTNALEAVAKPGGPPGGRIRIRSVREDLDGVPVSHLFFEDNGVGIEGTDLQRIFERGFSTKGRGTGLGLHWSANTINNMNGRIYAESDGRGRGACFHLILPAASMEPAQST